MINDLVSQASLVSREDSTVYCGNFIYKNGSWTKVLIPNGYITKNKYSQQIYHYYIKDHLGSNRVVVDENGNMVQAVEYYPSGIPVSKNDLKDNHLHTGKEFERMHGLHWYDNNKRMYDPILCRFTTMDPLCEKYYDTSPYAHCGNNPVNNIDLNGDSIWFSYQWGKDDQLSGVTMHVTGKVMNDAQYSVNVGSAINNITSGIERAFNGKVGNVSFNADVQISEAKNMNEVKDSDHLFVLTDRISEMEKGEVYGVSNELGGKVAFINAAYFQGSYDEALGSRNYGTFTATHEFGHLGGLGHNTRNPFNLMKSNGHFYFLNSDQLSRVYSNWKSGNLNKGSNYELHPFWGKRPNKGGRGSAASIYVR